MLHDLTIVAFIAHIVAGTVALVAGSLAVVVAKGGRLHRRTGSVFAVAMIVMAAFAGYLAVAMPGQIVNLVIAIFATYLVATAWLTVSRAAGTTGAAERIALGISVALCAPFVVLAVQLAAGLPPLFHSATPFKGPIVVAIDSFALVTIIATIADARVVIAGGIAGPPRIARHLWRMCLGLTLAVGSAFTNGVPRLLPGPYHVPPALFYPQFVPLALLVFWLIRVRLTGWRGVGASAPVVTLPRSQP